MGERKPLTDPATGEPLPQVPQPGYYFGYSTLSQQDFWDQATRDVVLKRVNHVPPIRFFNQEEGQTMLAVVDRIVPQDDRTPDRRIPLLPALDERLHMNRLEGYRYEDMPPDQQAYRIAAKAFEAMAQQLHGTPFHLLSTMQQESIILSIHDGKPSAAVDLWDQMNVERFWTLLVSDCCSAYYSHPWAWDEIGFGGPAYPRAYMRLANGQPEPWEKGEQRYQWAAPEDTLSDQQKAHGTGKEHQTHHGQAGTH